MRIAIDLRWIRSKQFDGISRYALNLVSHLLQIDTSNEYLLIGKPDILAHHGIPASGSSAEIVSIPYPLLSIQDFLLTPRAIERLNIDIWHVPNYLCSPFTGRYKKILTVHDLIPLLFPDALSKSRILWQWFYKTPYPAQQIVRSAEVIITCSDHTKHDIIRLLNVPPERIYVVFEGLDKRFHAQYSVPDSFYQHHQLPPQFLLYVGRQDPYKGLTYLVQAYACLPERMRREYRIVIAGKTDLRYIKDIHALIERLDLQEDFIFLDYVPDEELPLLYSAAALLVHPALYEGFGLPPLEAMACGTPVIYAKTSSLTELLGHAGFAVKPASAGSLADGIRQLLEQPQLRQEVSQQGQLHAQRYSWKLAASEVLRIYTQLFT